MAINTQLQMITPEDAKFLLTNNNSNRSIRKNHVLFLSNLIKNNFFKSTHQGIAISKSGRLLDGQHRLLACIHANKPIEILVSYGLDDDAFMAMDCGMIRSIADRTSIKKKTSEITRYLLRVGLNQESSKNPEINIMLAESGISELHDELMSVCSTNKRTFSSAQIRSAICYLAIIGHDKNYMFSAYKDLVNSNFPKFNPCMTSFYKQYAEKKPIGFDTELYTKAVKVFDIKNKDLKQLKLSEFETQTIVFDTKKTIKKLINYRD